MLSQNSAARRRERLLATTRSMRGAALGLAVASVALGLALTPVIATPALAAPAKGAPVKAAPTKAAPTEIAGPGDLPGAIAQATKLEVQILANAQRADVLDERFLQARAAAAVANKSIVATQRQISATDAKLVQLHRRLAGRAAFLYMGAGTSDPIGIDASSVQDLGSRATYGDAAAVQDQRIVDDLNGTEARLNAQHDELAGRLAAAQDRVVAARDARLEVARVNGSMQNLLDSTKTTVRVLAAKMEQDAFASAAVAEPAWLKRFAAQQAAARKKGGAAGGDPLVPGPGDGKLSPPVAGALLAVAYAEAQLGKPYVYAAAGPDAFDCSGLTMMAWSQAGVLMEHGSQAQYNAFPHVPIDQLQPGDLVFFGTSGPANHHVGIVVGPGVMIDAPHTGAFVELVSYFQPDLVPLGARPSPSP
jgi:cell wall-associated NlpC family hydrolase